MMRKNAYTLIEILVVVSILALIVSAIGACMMSGIRTWQMASSINIIETEIHMAENYLRKDMANTFKFYGIRFSGEQDAISFPGMIADEDAPDSDSFRICTVRYFYNQQLKALERQISPFAVSGSDLPKRELIAEKITALNFKYQIMSPNGELQWVESWSDPTNNPVSVKVEMTVVSGEAKANIDREIALPQLVK